MAAHRPHPLQGLWSPDPLNEGSRIYNDPDDALLYDDCPRCDQQAAQPLHLDPQKLDEAWNRMFHVERHDGFYRTVNERILCVRIYEAALVVARIQGHGDPWRLVPQHAEH